MNKCELHLTQSNNFLNHNINNLFECEVRDEFSGVCDNKTPMCVTTRHNITHKVY